MSSVDAPPRALEIVYRPLKDLKHDPATPRTHPPKQVEQLARNIRAFGFVNPILVDEARLIIAGHGRALAAKKGGLEAVPTITLSGLSEAQKKALRIADNRIAQKSGWDADLLREMIVDIQSAEIEIDLELTGFTVGEIDVMLEHKPLADNDDAPPTPSSEPPRAKLGDIWVLGDHRIGCGDCRDPGFLGRVVGEGAKIDAAFLDPPYNVAIQGHANVRSKHREFAMASGEMSNTEFEDFLKQTLGACASVSRDGAVHFVCMDWRHARHLQHAGDQVYGDLLNLCIWNKSNAGMGSLYRSKHELVFVYRVGEAQHFNAVELGKHGRNRTNVWDYASVNSGGSRAAELDWHPTVKPVAMVSDAIKDVTKRGQLVLDAFLGSGTTLIAAERAGRRCRGVEIDPIYIDTIIQRWEAMTGLTATLEDTLETQTAGAW
ncbi:site-specific DNA-methyltransferase [Brevundimonas naejangsanensis]